MYIYTYIYSICVCFSVYSKCMCMYLCTFSTQPFLTPYASLSRSKFERAISTFFMQPTYDLETTCRLATDRQVESINMKPSCDIIFSW